jgi:hypothetical protein
MRKVKKIPFFQEKIKKDGLNKFLGHVSPFLMPIILLGIETFGPAKYTLVSFWQPRQPWWPRQLAMLVAKSLLFLLSDSNPNFFRSSKVLL